VLAVAGVAVASAATVTAPASVGGGHFATENPATENPATENPATERPATERPGTERPAAESAAVAYRVAWRVTTPGVVALSSPIPDIVGGERAVVVGTRGGQIVALSLRSGRPVPHFPVTVPGSLPVDSTPSVNGSLLYVGVGDAYQPAGGGYLALNADTGAQAFFTQVASTPGSAATSGVTAGMTVSNLQGIKTVTAGSMGQYADSLDATTGVAMSGFPWFSSDTELSTAAVANLYGNGRNYIVSGAEQTGGQALGHQYSQGGHLRILAETGNSGTEQADGGLRCDYTPDQGVESSPAVGTFLARRGVGIVVGTSTDFPGASDTDKLIALNTRCGVVWKDSLDGATIDSPALVDALGDGRLEVAEGTAVGAAGTVYLLDGATGAPIWSRPVPGMVIGSITSADLGSGYQDLLVPTTRGLFILDGRTGARVAAVGGIGLQSSPLVTNDGRNALGITLAGYGPDGGIIIHLRIVEAETPHRASEAGAWPMFHHDPQLTGTTLEPLTLPS
jgi:outer membrane protein assembly factor BamB